MKKILLFWTILLLTLSASSAWAEKRHTAVKGDCLWILHVKYHVSVESIQKANKLGNSTILKLGHVYIIPESNNSEKHSSVEHTTTKQKIKKSTKHAVTFSDPYWITPGANPFRATFSEGFDIFNLTPEDKAGLLVELKKGHSIGAYAQHISKGNYDSEGGLVIAENGKKYRPMIMLSGGGGRNPIDVKTGPNGVINNWSDKMQVQGGQIYTYGQISIMNYYKCGNIALLEEIKESKVTESKITEKSSSTETKVSASTETSYSLSVFPGINPSQTRARMKNRDNYDFLAGNGNYVSRLAGSDNNGGYFWGKARGRFFWLDYTDQGISIGVGVFGFIAGGNGKAARYYKYGWDEKVIGATAKLLAKHSDGDLDIGAGRLNNHGRWKNDKENKQRDDIVLASIHGNFHARRDMDKLWLPKYELNLEARFPFNTKVYHGEKTNNRSIDFMYTQWIYDYKVNGDNSLVIAPGLNLGFGYEWSSPDHPAYAQFGPAGEISSYGNVLGDISLFNYKAQGSGQIHPYSFFVSFDGLWNAWEASQVREATAADLKNLPANGESKLLHNPADYLK